MDIKEFAEKAAENVRSILNADGEKISTQIVPVVKNNDVMLTALNINPVKTAGDVEISPNIYMEPYYKKYKEGVPVSELIDEIISAYTRGRNEKMLDIAAAMDDYEADENIIVRLVSRSRNSKILADAPNIEFADLAVTFRRLIAMDDNNVATALITNRDMHRWKMSIDELYKKAVSNTMRLFPEVYQNIYDNIMERYHIDDDSRDEFREIVSPGNPLCILTNKMGLDGATSILYDGVLEKCAEYAGGDIYLLPSSVHEFLFVKADESVSAEHLRQTVEEANKVAVAPMDYLSDSVYLYKQDSAELRIVSPDDK